MANELLAVAYGDVDESKAARLQGCATRLGFKWHDDELRYRLKHAWFCRVRLCPMCTWRRSLKVAGQMRRVMDAIKADKPMAYIMVTLTVKNCGPDDLGDGLSRLMEGFNRFTKTKDYKTVSRGYYKAVEITHNVDPASKDYDTFHPHIHAVFAVSPSYFTSRDYIKQDRWTELWKRAAKLDYTPIVHVQRVKGDTAKAVAEVAKYAIKASDYILPDDWELTVETVRLLDAVLANRRFVGYGGIFREYHKKLNLDNAEDGDLIHVEDDPLCPDSVNDDKIISFGWFSGYRQFRRIVEI